MAAVYAVRLGGIGGFGKLLAMKVLLPHLEGPDIVTMFLDEARIAAQIHHPNVAQLFELGEHEGTPFMVMELLRGRSLAQLADRAYQSGRPLEPALVLRILADAARGLHAAHEARGEDGQPLHVVHRDVSPQNVHVGYDGIVRVVDFGIARARGRMTQTDSGTVKGKLRYLAPEQLSRTAPVDRRVDLWALGVMAWELLAVERLFRDDDEATSVYNVLHKEVPPLRERVPDLAPEVDALVSACLSRNVAARPATAEEVARVLDAAARALDGTEERVRARMEGLFAEERAQSELDLARAVQQLESPKESPPAKREPAAVPAPRPARRSAILLGAAALLVVVAVLTITLVLSLGEPDAMSLPTVSTEPVPSVPVPSVPAPAPAGRRVRLVLGEGARAVHVGGQRHERRELTVPTRPGQTTLAVELEGTDGSRRTLELDITQAEHVLTVAPSPREPSPQEPSPEEPSPQPNAEATSRPVARRRPREEPPAASTPTTSTPTQRGLLGNPY
jgi:serine/threonine-protein kinase